MSMNRIVVGVDGSEDAIDALSWADRLALASGADLRVVSAWHIPTVTAMPETVAYMPTRAEMSEHASTSLDKTLGDQGIAGRCEPVVVEGPAGPVLAAESDSETVVVVGRRGFGHHAIARVAKLVLGSVSHHLVHNAVGPVAVVPRDPAWVDAPRVVIGVDGSPASLEALAWAVDELPADAELVAVRAFVPTGNDVLAPLDLGAAPDLLTRLEDELRSWVDDVVARCSRSDAEVGYAVDVGSARYLLTNPANDADLIVVGHRGRSGLVARVLGSVADHVVRHADVPVVVVRGAG